MDNMYKFIDNWCKLYKYEYIQIIDKNYVTDIYNLLHHDEFILKNNNNTDILNIYYQCLQYKKFIFFINNEFLFYNKFNFL